MGTTLAWKPITDADSQQPKTFLANGLLGEKLLEENGGKSIPQSAAGICHQILTLSGLEIHVQVGNSLL